MSAQFPKRSTRPLTGESYRRAAQRVHILADAIDCWSSIVEPSPAERRRLTRAIKDLDAHSARLLERHKEQI